jgi:hypothetical protein
MDESTLQVISDPASRRPRSAFLHSRYERCLVVLFLVSLPLLNPWVHGDGVGYYAFARSLLIEHRLDFRADWLNADAEFRQNRVDAQGRLTAANYTATGHINNHYSIGPAILWSPFLIIAHAGVLISDRLGAHVLANGYSKPYLVAMAFGTAFYGFLGLLISFYIASRYVSERWAFLATVGIWAASSLPVYMYLNPSWSHAQSVFAVALFIWYWLRTRPSPESGSTERTWRQWCMLGLIGGLMMEIRYTDGIFFLLPLLDSLSRYWVIFRSESKRDFARPFLGNAIFLAGVAAALLPTFVSKKIIYGSYFSSGYRDPWFWNSPAFLKVCFSSDHGFFTWTPILLVAVIGLVFLRSSDGRIAAYCLTVFGAYVYVLGCYGIWDGLSSFGNRYFVSLTPIFILGLAALFDRLAGAWNSRRTFALASTLTALLILWNFGMMYQWGMHLVPVRGPISWKQAAYNQFAVVPSHIAGDLERYFLRRGKLMQHIEKEDVRQLKARPN